MKKVLVLLTGLFLSHSTYSQQSPAVVNQAAEWFALTSTMTLGPRFGIYADIQFRYVQSLQPMQYQYRIAGEYTLSPKVTVSPIAYVYVRNFIYGNQPSTFQNNEHRIYQQVIYKNTMGRFAFNHRFRVEERFIQFHSLNSSNEVVDEGFTNFQMRLRYRAWVSYPLNTPEIKAKTVFLSVFDEVFISRGSQVVYLNPDQNRLFVGLGYQFTKDVSLQSGFFWQALIKPSGTQQENNIGVLTQLSYNFDFSKPD